MLKIQVLKPSTDPLKILFLGAHSDDIEIGCGGTILRLASEYPELEVTWVVFSATGERGKEAKESAHAFLKNVKYKNISLHEFKDGYFPYQGAQIKDIFEQLKRDLMPEMVFTHYRHDLHQDHRLLSELTWNTWRDHLIFEYEIPKYDGDFGTPNLFVPLDHKTCQEKVDYLVKHFNSQKTKKWFTEDTFFSVLRLRGIECGTFDKYAEAFYSRKMIF